MRDLFDDKAKRRQAGVTTIFMVFAMAALIGIGALAIDAGLIYAARGQLQNTADAAALAAGQAMFGAGGTLNRAAGTTAAEEVALLHRAASETAVVLDPAATPSDIMFGDWDEDLRVFTEIPSGALNEGEIDAAKVRARLDGTPNEKVPALLSKVQGWTDFEVKTLATAYIGFAREPGLGDVDLPIAVDCCAINACPDGDPNTEYCSGGVPPLTNEVGCDLDYPQTGDAGESRSCLDFHSTGVQNACWTLFDSQSSVNADDLRQLVEGGQYDGITPDPVAGELYNLDNGDKVPVLRAISRRFSGYPPWINPDPLTEFYACDPGIPGDCEPCDPPCAPGFEENPNYGVPDTPEIPMEGTDAYAPFDGMADQWYKVMPVFECQNGVDQCAGGQNQKLLGFVCTEIREVAVPDNNPQSDPDDLNSGVKQVRLNFVCPTLPGGAANPAISNCQLNGGGPVPGGGGAFGLRATIPVLVE